MADISKITTINGTTYDLKDAFARGKFPVATTDGGTGATTALNGFWNLENRGHASDANGALSVGLYNTNASTTNLPANAYLQSNGCGVLIVYVSDAATNDNTNNWIWQMWLNTATNELYIRKKINAVNWGAWQTQLNALPSFGTGTTDPSIRPYVSSARANRLAFLPADQVIIEETTDGGQTWTSGGYNNSQKRMLFSTRGARIDIPRLNGAKSTNCGVRITITGMKYNVPSSAAETGKYSYWNSSYVSAQERYCNLREMWFWMSANTDNVRCQVYRASGESPNNWLTCFDTNFGMSGWSGSDWIRFDGDWTFGGALTQTGNYWNWRIILWSRIPDGYTSFQSTTQQYIAGISGYGDNVWVAPNGLVKEDHLYTWDANMNATFPAQVAASSFSGSGASLTALNGSNISSGTVAADRIAELAASKITSGTFDSARIPDLDASKITSGSVSADRIGYLPATIVTSGTFNAARIPDLDASKITSGTINTAQIPSLDASKVGSGTLDTARLPTSGVTSGSYGPAANATPEHGGTFSVPYVTVDDKGRTTAAATKTITLPSYSTATSSDDGLMSATDKSKLDNLSTIQLSSGINLTEDTDGLIVTFVD